MSNIKNLSTTIPVKSMKPVPSLAPSPSPLTPLSSKEEDYESFTDNKVFFPITNKLIDLIKPLNIESNVLFYIGSILRLVSIYFIYNANYHIGAAIYFIAYIFDCISDKMDERGEERNTLTFGINLIIAIMLINNYGLGTVFSIIIIIMLFMLSVNYGLTEAIVSYLQNGNDNFITKRELEMKDNDVILDQVYLLIKKINYFSYRIIFPTYDQNKIVNLLQVIKEFGNGNFALVMTFMIFNL